MVNAVTLAYIEQGQGAPVVHGAFSDLRAWELQREAVARRFRFIVYTQRYFGTGLWPDQGEQYSQVAHAADEATRLFADWTNGQPGGFDALLPETRSMHHDNGRTIALHFAAAPPPKLSCADLGQMKRPLGITYGELTRPFFKILAETAHNCVPGSQLIPIPGARHAATSQNQAAFNNALLTFLASHWHGPGRRFQPIGYAASRKQASGDS